MVLVTQERVKDDNNEERVKTYSFLIDENWIKNLEKAGFSYVKHDCRCQLGGRKNTNGQNDGSATVMGHMKVLLEKIWTKRHVQHKRKQKNVVVRVIYILSFPLVLLQ